MAKRLIENDLEKKIKDGFKTDNGEEKGLYLHYKDRINEIKNFFKNNKKTINNINNGIDIDFKITKRFIKRINKINERDKSNVIFCGEKNETSQNSNLVNLQNEDEENDDEENDDEENDDEENEDEENEDEENEDEENEKSEENEKTAEELENEIRNNPSIYHFKKFDEEKNEILLDNNL